MGKSSQRKGRAAEMELVKILRDNGFNVRPGEAVSYGTEPDIVGLPGIHVEVKRHEALRIGEWTQQAEADAEKFHDGLPVVFFRRSREPWRVTMSFADFMRIYQRAIMGGFEHK